MNFIEKLILGLIQAILEWLPVSSEGFLILFAVNIFGENTTEALRLAIYFHLGTAIAVLIKYWHSYWDAVIKDRDVLRFLIITTLFTGIVGIPLYLLLGEIFTNFTGMFVTLFIGITLLVTGSLLRTGKLKATNQLEMDKRTIKDEIFLGVCQGLAILPGISRSGTTVTFLLLKGFKKEDAFKMSFLISLPAVLGAIAFDLIFQETSIGLGWEYAIITLIVAVFGYITMGLLLRIARKLEFDKICYILGGITILLVLLFYIFNLN